jgi:DNA-binding FadR family transcriptional regulator
LDWINSSRYGPGDKIPTERQLALSLKQPRHVVRSALLALTAQGLLVRHVGRGTYVASRDMAAPQGAGMSESAAPSLAEILEARLAFEPALARLASTRTSLDEIDRLERRRAAFDQARRLADLEKAEADFYRTLAEVVGNTVLADMAQVLTTRWQRLAEARSNALPVTEARRESAHEAARELIEAIRELDGPRAERARVSALLDLMQRFSIFAMVEETLGTQAYSAGNEVAGDGPVEGDAESETDSGDR